MFCPNGYEVSQISGKCIKSCLKDQERNPVTNRCRKIKDKSRSPAKVSPRRKSRSPAKVSPRRKSRSPVRNRTVCPEGYEVSEKTGKCVKICREGQVRNPETGRCRKNLSKSPLIRKSRSPAKVSPRRKSRSPAKVSPRRKSSSSVGRIVCPEGYEVSKKTGKCVKICREGQVRNPNTGRCEKKFKSKLMSKMNPIEEQKRDKVAREKLEKIPEIKPKIHFPRTDTFAMDDPFRRVRFGGPKQYNTRTDIEGMIALGKKK